MRLLLVLFVLILSFSAFAKSSKTLSVLELAKKQLETKDKDYNNKDKYKPATVKVQLPKKTSSAVPYGYFSFGAKSNGLIVNRPFFLNPSSAKPYLFFSAEWYPDVLVKGNHNYGFLYEAALSDQQIDITTGQGSLKKFSQSFALGYLNRKYRDKYSIELGVYVGIKQNIVNFSHDERTNNFSYDFTSGITGVQAKYIMTPKVFAVLQIEKETYIKGLGNDLVSPTFVQIGVGGGL